MRCLLVGNYGDANFGDEALKACFLERFPEVEWTVVSARPGPGEVPRLPMGMRSLFGTPWGKTLSAIRRSDAVVFGGGTLFTDAESVRACVLWCVHALAAQMFRVPRLFCVQGIGPFRSRFARWLTRRAFRGAAFVSVRDPESERRAAELGLSTDVVRAFDPVFTLFEAKKSSSRAQEVLVIIPRLNSGEAFDAAVRSGAKEGTRARILSFQPDEPAEHAVCARLQGIVPGAEVQEVRTVADACSALSDARLVVTHRYHGGIAALGLGIPTVIVRQAAGDKLDVLAAAAADPVAQEQFRALIRRGEDALHAVLARLPAR